ncbi:MAG: diaminopropionate ammonia-lyase, partial [Mogibacterium sp.]|nr:diaminopropionate ammonia-lyase [Mogibacterium sp.]
ACLYESAKAGDGQLHSIEGDPVTIMAGLNCGTPCSITWPVIRDRAGFYISCMDEVSENAMRRLAGSSSEQERIISGESGAVTFGALMEICKDEQIRTLMGVDRDSVILLISTEGDTDPEGYRRIVG